MNEHCRKKWEIGKRNTLKKKNKKKKEIRKQEKRNKKGKKLVKFHFVQESICQVALILLIPKFQIVV